MLIRPIARETMKAAHCINAFLVVSLGAGLQGQAKPTAPAQPVTTQPATTEDGRKVVLKSNGTWKYADDSKSGVAASAKATPDVAQGTLALEVGLVFNSGDVKPVARTDFFLLDKSFPSIVMEAGVVPIEKYSVPSHTPEEKVLFGFGMSLRTRVPDDLIEFGSKAKGAVKPHVLYTVTTDFGGKATFQHVRAGTYFLMGYTAAGGSFAIWNMPVTIKNGKMSIILDNKNAAMVQ
jgi:hypothetical protein